MTIPGHNGIQYLSPDDYFLIASHVLNMSPSEVKARARVDLVESALAVPQSGFGDRDFFPSIEEKTAILVSRLAKNHGLDNGNKRMAFVAGVVFAEVNGFEWIPPEADARLDPSTGLGGEETAQMMNDMVDGSAKEADFLGWVKERMVPTLERSQVYGPAEFAQTMATDIAPAAPDSVGLGLS